jgi:DNA-binding Xre family transcriptional regulator
MTPEDIRTALKDRRLDMVSNATGLHVNTIRKIRDGKSTNSRYDTIAILTKYLESARG